MTLVKNFIFNKKNYYLIFLPIIYIIYLIGFYDFSEQSVFGKGFIHKISLILFDTNIPRILFVCVSFFISWIIILIYIENKLIDILTIVYFFVLSLFITIFQEYFDPLILLMVFTFFSSKLIINYKNSTVLYIYLSILLIGSNIYYANLLN